MNSINSTLLALQIMNGAKVYDVRFISITTGKAQQKSYYYKSLEELQPGQAVVVPTFEGESFAVGIVESEAQDLDIDGLAFPLRWVCFTIPNPMQARTNSEAHDKQALAKLAQGRAKKAAKDYLEAAGLNASDFAAIGFSTTISRSGPSMSGRYPISGHAWSNTVIDDGA